MQSHNIYQVSGCSVREPLLMSAHVIQHVIDRFATNPGLPLVAPVKLVAQTSIKHFVPSDRLRKEGVENRRALKGKETPFCAKHG